MFIKLYINIYIRVYFDLLNKNVKTFNNLFKEFEKMLLMFLIRCHNWIK